VPVRFPAVTRPRPRLLAFDIDGTLIRPSGEVSPRVCDALVLAREAGMLLAVSTGRPWPQARDVVLEAGGMDYGVCLNGAVVVDGVTGQPLAVRSMPVDQARRAAEVARRLLPGASLAADMADGRHFWELDFHPFMPMDVDVIRVADAVAEVDGPVLTWLVGGPDHDPARIIDTVHHHLPPGVEIRPSGLDMAEIAAHGVSKASGLQIVTDRHHIRRDEVMAFGDGLNDIEMLRWAGQSVAMANGHEVVRDLARHIAPANDDDGVAVVIENLLADW
jgi:Cof subfamily protein (haloacid dehalogenase superfamily)